MSDIEFDPFIAKVARELREPVELDARFDARVMALLEPPVISLDSRRVAQPWYRRHLAVPAPVAGLAAAAAFAGIAAVGILARQPAVPMVATTPAEQLVPVNETGELSSTATAPVQFAFVSPDAESVGVVGDFNDWQPSPMSFDRETRTWRLTLQLPVGVHEYQFVVNGSQHVADPSMPPTPSEFGTPNSIVKVTPVR